MRYEQAHPLPLHPIGVVRSPYLEKMSAPRQGTLARGVVSRIELLGDPRLGHALEGIEQWSHLWVLFWFDRDPHFSPKVQPPRSYVRRGVLSTRSPHRPNPIGLSAAKLLKVEGQVLFLEGLDLLDGTPVVDLKPYVPYADRIAEASDGWLEIDSTSGGWNLKYSELLEEQLAFLAARQIFLREMLEQILEAGPAEHPSRRIRRKGDRALLALKDFRLTFQVVERTLELLRLESGYSPRQLLESSSLVHQIHREFAEIFGRLDAAAWLDAG